MANVDFSEMPKVEPVEPEEFKGGKGAEIVDFETIQKQAAEAHGKVTQEVNKSFSARADRARSEADALKYTREAIGAAESYDTEPALKGNQSIPGENPENPAGNSLTRNQLQRERSWIAKIMEKLAGK